MSTTWKLGVSALCTGFSAYLLGLRLAQDPTWRLYAAAVSLTICLTVFLLNLLRLHKTLSALSTDRPGLRDASGKLLIP